MQLNLFEVESEWTPPQSMPDLDGDIAIDLETNDPTLKTLGPGYLYDQGHVAGISIATKDFNGYFPIGHQMGGNLDKDLIVNWLNSQLSKPNNYIFANAPYDIGWMEYTGIKINKTNIHDIQIMAPLLDEHKFSYSLDNLGKEYVNDQKDETLLKEAASSYGFKKDYKSEMWRMPAKYVGPYAEQDSALTLKLYYLFDKMLEEQDLKRIYNLERKLIPLLLDMRRKGIRVDIEKAKKLKNQWMKVEQAAIKKLTELTGLHIDVYSARSCALALDKVGVEYKKTVTGEPSIDKDFFSRNSNNRICKLIEVARKYQKAYSTFIDGFILKFQYKGRVYPQFNQLRSDDGGTVSGRFSCTMPNVQQIPARDPKFGKQTRSLYLPEEGELWAACDYSSQEPRLTIHYAAVAGVRGGREAASKFGYNTDYHQMIADICHIKRKAAKTINLGLAYGMGGAKLCRSLGLPTERKVSKDGKYTYEVAGEEGQALLDEYHSKFPAIGALSELCQNRAKRRGYITTLLGRRCRFKPDSNEEYRALNRLIQGSAADQTKLAFLTVYEKLGKLPLVQVHDELGYSVKDEEEGKMIGKIMETCIQLQVPSKVDVEIGKNWGDSMG